MTPEQRIQELEAENAFLHDILDHLPVMIVVKDRDGRFQLANQRLAEVYGTTKEAIIGKTDADFNDNQEELEQFLQKDQEAIDKGKPIHIAEEPVTNSNGETRYYETNKIPLKNEQGVYDRVLLVVNDIHERKQAEENLRVFKSIADNAADCIVLTDPEMNVIYVNDAVREMYGYEPEELIGGPSLVVWPEESLPRLQEELAPLMMTTGYHGDELQVRKDGSRFYVNAVAFALFDDDHNPTNVVALLRDKSDEIAAQDQLRNFKAMADNAKDCILMADMETNIIYANDAIYDLYGYKPEEIIGESALKLWAEEEIPKFQMEIGPAMVSNGYNGDTLQRRKDGTNFYVNATAFALFDENQTPANLVAILRDITEQKEAATILKEQRQFLRQVIDAIPSVIYVKDRDGVYSLANKTLADSYGIVPDDIIGKTDLELGMKQEEFDNFLKMNLEIIESGKPNYVPEAPFTNPETGEVRYYQAFNVPIKSTGDEYDQLLGVAMDVTERKQAEEERERLQHEIISAQRQALSELSTPIIPLVDGIIVMPLIGTIDTQRSRDITRSLLAGITEYRAKYVILDITGVPIVDTGVADHLNKTIQAARLKGTQTIVTGISDAVAETVVDLGIDWSAVDTLRDLQTGLVTALERLGYYLARG